jgi:hypothetical protein
MHTLYHGTNNPHSVIEALLGAGKIRTGFHMSPSFDVAQNYGHTVIAITIMSDLSMSHIGLINKEGNSNKVTGNGIEYVLKDDAAVSELYSVLWDAAPVL